VVPETVVALVGLLPLVVEVPLLAVVGCEVTFARKKRLTIVYTYKQKDQTKTFTEFLHRIMS
jgi:hypothetical protein